MTEAKKKLDFVGDFLGSSTHIEIVFGALDVLEKEQESRKKAAIALRNLAKIPLKEAIKLLDGYNARFRPSDLDSGFELMKSLISAEFDEIQTVDSWIEVTFHGLNRGVVTLRLKPMDGKWCVKTAMSSGLPVSGFQASMAAYGRAHEFCKALLQRGMIPGF